MRGALNNVTTNDGITTRIFVTDVGIVRTVKIDNDKEYGYYNEIIMTKEVFIECYQRWIKGGAI